MSAPERLRQRISVYERAHRELASELATIGPIWNGTVSRQLLTCGKSNCACGRDAARRHGPYLYWSTKIKGRTVSRRLTREEADLYEEWIRNRRKLEGVQKRMLALSKQLAPLMLQGRDAEREDPLSNT